MFKIISKKKYDAICTENEMLHKEIECMIAEREEGISTNHACHSVFCKDCVHALMVPRTYDSGENIFCKLDRHCKDYEKKELTEENGSTDCTKCKDFVSCEQPKQMFHASSGIKCDEFKSECREVKDDE